MVLAMGRSQKGIPKRAQREHEGQANPTHLLTLPVDPSRASSRPEIPKDEDPSPLLPLSLRDQLLQGLTRHVGRRVEDHEGVGEPGLHGVLAGADLQHRHRDLRGQRGCDGSQPCPGSWRCCRGLQERPTSLPDPQGPPRTPPAPSETSLTSS